MNDNDGLHNKSSNIRLRHMFLDEANQYKKDYQVEDLDEETLSKISLKFMSQDEDETTLVDSFKKIVELNSTDLTTPMLEEIENLKETYYTKPPLKSEVVVEEMEDNPLVEVDEDIDIDIDSLIQTTEKDIFKSNNKKELLFNLINDINGHPDSDKFKYDDEQFEKNIHKIINDKDDDMNDEKTEVVHNNIESQTKEKKEEPINKKELAKEVKTKNKASLFILILLILSIFVLIYVYKGTILKILQTNGLNLLENTILEIDGESL